MGFASLIVYENFFKQIDMYGQKIELNFQKKNEFKTTFGGILTFLIILIFGLGVWFFGKELIQRNNPTVITQQRAITSPQRIDINKNNLILMVGIANVMSQPFVDPTLFSARSYQEKMVFYNDTKTGKQLKKVIQVPKELKICEESDIGIVHISSYFLQMDLSKLYCFKEQELFMEGDFDADEFSQVYFSAEKCKNGTDSKVICKTPQQIEDALRVTKIQLFFSDKTVNPNDYDNPFFDKGTSQYSPTSSTLTKELHLFFTNQYIESDIGILYEQIQTKHSFIYTDMKEMASFNDPNTLVRVLFRLQKSKENLMQRRYTKFADVVAQIGGLLKILVAFGYLLSYPFSKLYLNKAIVDEVFNFDYKDKINPQDNLNGIKTVQSQIKEINQQNQKKIKKKSPFNQNDLSINQNQSNQDQNAIYQDMGISVQSQKKKKVMAESNMLNSSKQRRSILDIAKGLFQVTKNKITFNFLDVIKHIISNKNTKQSNLKHELVQKAIKKVDNYLDFFFILNKFHEIDKIKTILLNQDQLKLFEYIPKPVIQSEQELLLNEQQNEQNNISNKGSVLVPMNDLKNKKVYSVLQENKSDEEKAVDAYEGLANILKKNKRNKIDDKLVELIDPSILYQIIKKEEKAQDNQTIIDNVCQTMIIQNDDNCRSYDKEIEDLNTQKQLKSNHHLLQRVKSASQQIQKIMGMGSGILNSPSSIFQQQQGPLSPTILSKQDMDIKSQEDLPNENEIDVELQESQQAQKSEFQQKPENIFFPKSVVNQMKNSFLTLKSNDNEDQKLSPQSKEFQLQEKQE